MICYEVIDTNFLVSALLSKNESAATVQVLMQLISGRITPVYSNEIISEYREVLSRKKFKFPYYIKPSKKVNCIYTDVCVSNHEVILTLQKRLLYFFIYSH